MGSTLLSYAVSANQDPIQASPEVGDPSLLTLIIVVSAQGHHSVDCQSISFGFIQGTVAKDLFSDSTGIATAAPNGWSIAQDGSIFTATPDTPEDGEITGAGLTFVLSNIKVNQQVGTTQMTITEATASGTAMLEVPLAKFPPQFYVGNLNADPDTVEPGDSTTLSWDGSSDATYELHYTDTGGHLVTITHPKDEPDQPLPSTGSYEVDGLQKNTTFYLKVTATAAGQSEPLVVERNFPVTVEIPNVQIVSFTANPSVIVIPQGTTPPTTSVTLSWQVVGASQVLLNGTIVEGNSSVISVSENTTFTLEATGNPYPVFASTTVTFKAPNAQISLPSADSVEVTFDADAGTYTVDWSVSWETGETAGTSTNSMTVTSSGGQEVVVWNNVPMDMPPPYAQIVNVNCTITGFPGGPVSAQWSMS